MPSPGRIPGGGPLLVWTHPLKISELVTLAQSPQLPLRLGRIRGSAGAWLAAELRAAHRGPILVVAPGSTRAEEFAAALRAFSPETEVRILPRYDVPPYDRFSAHPEIEARRMSLLYSWLSAGPETGLTVVAPWSALLRRVPSRSELRSRVTHLERGLSIDRDALVDVLVQAGYQRTSLVEERGEVGARGGIVDLFPPQLDRPVRIEFDFDSIGSLRRFDPTTQRSEGELDSIVAIPPRAYRVPSDVDALIQDVRRRGRERSLPESQIYSVTEAFARRSLPPGVENLEALLHDELETVFDYLPPSTRILIDDPEAGRTRALAYMGEVFGGHERAAAQDRLVCEPLSLYVSDDSAWKALLARNPVLLDPLGIPDPLVREQVVDVRGDDHRDLRREIEEQRGSGHALQPLSRRLATWREQKRRVRIVCPTPSAAERLVDILSDYGLALPIARGHAFAALPEPGEIDVGVAPLADGFELPDDALVVLTEQNVFGQRQQRRAVRITRQTNAIERLAQIQEGDFLVHAEHGIGRFGGLVRISVSGGEQEFLLLLYDKADKLYVPVSRLGQVQRYASAEDASPALDRLGGQGWTRTKTRVRRAVQDMAEALLAVVAARETLEGTAFPAPDAAYEEFEARFRWDDTPDQRKVTDDVLGDMRKRRPMDRLVCGDVGFGKTEVACRAAYLCAMSGRQVAFLVPTTVLCQQHLETIRERFAGTPVEIAGLSRLSSPKQLREVREGLASGKIDLVVGTHRLLSKDITFRNLGLLIVDEEHRFGVAHKERLKQLRKLVDVLTLSATPIPRTLQMAFSGMRDLSVIATPPPDRTAVRTQIARVSQELISEAVERELRRGGQVFFVHNRVETIGEIAGYLQRILPSARFGIAHGQMSAQKLERVMLAFMHREYDVLVCTAIIESGLDIPNANTILIHRADMFGLAQLYQLRGRVGRGDRRAYAYLLLPATGQISDDAQRRIEAIQDLSELGAGFRLATEDLEIRGAGNLLGGEQSGHIASVGYDLYMEMMDEAMARLRGEQTADAIDPEIRLPLPALLPESYVPEVSQRLALYKQLSSARDDEELAALRGDLLDRFGALPDAAQNLLEVIRLKIRCRSLGVLSVEVRNGELQLRIAERAAVDPSRLVRVIGRPGAQIRAYPDRRLGLRLREPGDALAESFGLLDLLQPGEGTPVERSASR
ncbi:MAG: transcription-repair coupling factor [Deltaproteobacteria bacterium]|nr:transcription-repair coupling factor [Deltaproteobacteria bacterium]